MLDLVAARVIWTQVTLPSARMQPNVKKPLFCLAEHPTDNPIRQAKLATIRNTGLRTSDSDRHANFLIAVFLADAKEVVSCTRTPTCRRRARWVCKGCKGCIPLSSYEYPYSWPRMSTSRSGICRFRCTVKRPDATPRVAKRRGGQPSEDSSPAGLHLGR